MRTANDAKLRKNAFCLGQSLNQSDVNCWDLGTADDGSTASIDAEEDAFRSLAFL